MKLSNQDRERLRAAAQAMSRGLPEADTAWLTEVAKLPTLSALGFAAQEYAMRGWRVHPLAPRAKKPLLKAWAEQATADLAQVLAWWTEWPDANVGLVPGPRSAGLAVVDVDPRNGGMETLAKLRALFPGGVLPWAMHNLVRTGSGGYHLYLDASRHVAHDRPVPTTLGPGVEVHANDKLNIVAPPSVHPDGGVYTWLRGVARQTEPLGEYPDVWLTAVMGVKPVTTKVPKITGTDDVAKARRALARLNAERADRYDPQDGGWLAVGMALHAVSSELLTEWDAWSQSSSKYLAGVCAQKWATFKDTKDQTLGLGSLLAWAQADAVRVTNFTDITEEEIVWLWPGVVPYGKVTLIIGDPGHGKSYLTADLAARVSAGTKLPDGTKLAAADVLLVFYEDGAGDTVKPRLRVCGANQARVGQVTVLGDDGGDRLLNLERDLAGLEAQMVRRGTRLVVLDPVTAYLGPKVNSWKDDDVRRLLAPVAGLAERTGAAIVGILHLNKKQTANVLQRATGSGAFTAVARSVFMVGPHPEDAELAPKDQRRVFASAKPNLAAPVASRVFRITESADKIGRFVWEGETSATAKDMVTAELTGVPTDGKVGQAVRLLKDQLRDGPQPATTLFNLARTQSISEKTLRRAAEMLDVVKQKEGTGKQQWIWRLPDAAAPPLPY